jgi:hypothetical protein
MPVVAYYLGRPARIWIAAMSGSARAAPENPATTAPRPARRSTPATRRRTLAETRAPAATAVQVKMYSSTVQRAAPSSAGRR